MVIGLFLLGCLLAIAAVALVRSAAGRQDPAQVGTDSPERLLAQRFARGELDEEGYVQRLKVLSHTAP